MEDEDDNINTSNVTAVENDIKIDDPINIKKDVKKCVLPEDTCAEAESEIDASINRLKNSINCNDKESSDSLLNCKEVSGDSLATSRQKVNGEVDKNENVTLLGEPCGGGDDKEASKCVDDNDVIKESVSVEMKDAEASSICVSDKDVTKESVSDESKDILDDKDVTEESVSHESKDVLDDKDVTEESVSHESKDVLDEKGVTEESVSHESKDVLDEKDVTEESVSHESKDVLDEKDVTKEPVNDESKVTVKSMKRKVSVAGSSEGSNISENEVDGCESSSESSAAEVKGYKKRKINDVEKEKVVNNSEVKKQTVGKTSDEKTEEVKPKPVELRRSARNAANAKKNYCETNSVISSVTTNSVTNNVTTNSVETKGNSGDQLTEYAQYLGLQPTLKFKCGRCGEKHFQSMAALNAHQMICCKTVSNVLTKQNKPQSDTNLSTNFRITRKVYLCSACGTYYENWKLFLHMRDMHKRHICLFCLGMFSVAERLADHLLYQHNVHEKTCRSPEEFLNLFKGSCYLTCCSCEKMFTDRENFYDHPCKDSTSGSNRNNEANTLTAKEIRELAQKCALCGVKCGHFRTCPKVAHKFQSMPQPLATGSPTIPNSSSNLERFYIPVNSKGQNNWPNNSLDQDILKQALSGTQSGGDKDYYDAASFCHVDMAANDSDNVSSPSTPDENKSSDLKTKCASDKSPRRLSNEATETTINIDDDDDDKEEDESTVKNDRLTNDNLNSVPDSVDESNSQVDMNLSENKSDETTTRRDSSDISSDIEIIDEKEKALEKEIEKSTSPKTLQRFDEVDNVDSILKDGENKSSKSDDEIIRLDDDLKEDEVKNIPCSIKLCDNVVPNAENSLENNNVNENEDNVTDKVINSSSNHTEEESCSSDESSKLTNDNTASNSIEVKEKESNEVIDKVENESESECISKRKDHETVQCSVRLDRLDDSVKYISNSLLEDSQPEINSSNSNNDSDSSSSCSSTSSSSNSSRRSSVDINDINNTEDIVGSKEPLLNTEDVMSPTKEPSTKSVSVEGDDDDDDDEDKELDNDNRINDIDNDKTTSDTDNNDSQCNNDTEDSLQKLIEPISNNDTCNELSKVSSKEESELKDSDSDDDTMNGMSPSLDVPEDGDDSNWNLETCVKSQSEESCNNVNTVDRNSSEDNDVAEKEPEINDSKIESNMEMEVEDELNSSKCDIDVKDDNDDEQIKGDSSENDVEIEGEQQKILPPKEVSFKCDGVTIQLANEEVLAMALTLEDKMDSLSSKCVVKECVRTSCTTCTYCSHAVKIGVNGKQLAIHLLTEHRYMPVKNETTDDVIERLKDSLAELQDVWFNTDSYDSSDKSCFVPHDHTYECFQCNYVTNTHKDLFSHKRKVHQKTILYCSMCKENFYSYSELLCHMCTGLYDATKDINFRCCLCDTDRIPSAFRLMVHLRKSHHTCDICLEVVDDQQKLSVHMVKHKLHHLCYRCGIAYRNKPDITKHLFWKHGTESVMCKKCLQKKWPHVYHFCVPPTSFICEECNLSFSKAVYLKVHKRLHSNNLPYSCEMCELKFVSKKLLEKHGKIHETPVVQEEEKMDNTVSSTTKDADVSVEQTETKMADETTKLQPQESATENCENSEKSNEAAAVKPHKKKNKKDKDKKIKPVVDVYDLPPLNLSSESDDTDEERDVKSTTTVNKEEDDEKEEVGEKIDTETSKEESKDVDMPMESADKDHADKPNEVISEIVTNQTESMTENEENVAPVTVVDGVWDSFHTYKAEKEKREHLDIVNKEALVIRHSVLNDHDYCLPNVLGPPEEQSADDVKGHSSSMDHDYCSQNKTGDGTSAGLITSTQDGEGGDASTKKKQKSPKKKAAKAHNSSSSSDSSSDSDSSSCSCGTNCSCSSSSSNSSSSSSSDSDSSSSDGKHNTSNSKREKKKEKSKSKKKSEVNSSTDVTPLLNEPVDVSVEPEEPLIRESDLDTDETATDEDFYDQYPQMRANQILSEKRNQLMMLATVAPTVNNGTLSPPVSDLNTTNINLDPVGSPTKLEIVTPPITPTSQSQNKRKVKTKKRRKSSFSTNKSRKSTSLHNDKNLQQLEATLQQASTSFSAIPTMSIKNTPNDGFTTTIAKQHLVSPNNGVAGNMSPQIQGAAHHANTSSSSKRSSKRRRVRNKFYGYSSDEDAENQQTPPPIKWKKLTLPPTTDSVKQAPQQLMNVHPQYNNTFLQHPVPPKIPPVNIRAIFENNQNNDNVSLKRPAAPPASSSSSSSDDDDDGSDSDDGNNRLMINPRQMAAAHHHAMANAMASTSEKDEKLYCYCQCPYDEVSEMIACDGIDCAIEWFHFECVGIMVPPKGKWYCPHCRKKRGLS